MFAVPGWSVSADSLRLQVDAKSHKQSKDFKSSKADNADKKSRKRKRGHGSDKIVEITEDNLGDLWRKHVEEKSLAVPNGSSNDAGEKQQRKRKREREAAPDAAVDLSGDAFEGFSDNEGKAEVREPELEKPLKKKEKKRKENAEVVEETKWESDQAHATEGRVSAPNEALSNDEKKAKFEERKAKAAKKREERAVLQANGTLPPPRVDSVPGAPVPAKLKKTKKTGEPSIADIAVSNKPPGASTHKDNPPSTIPADPPPPSTKLTPLQQRMAAKLTSARFRHLNQTLYTTPSDQAMQLFTDSPQAYLSYHAGFRAQVAVWPQNPVEGFITDIKARGSLSVPSQKKLWRDQKKGKKPKGAGNGDVTTTGDHLKTAELLPRNKHGICTIADLGCGDATFASSLAPVKKSLKLNILSFDLAKGDTPNAHLITTADITTLQAAGVADGTLDIAICCLSLMGTNWVNVIDECARAVRGGGELWVAEIKSRFARPGQLRKGEGKKGDGIGKKKKKGKSAAEAEGRDEEPADMVEVEEEVSRNVKDETDVSAFVEVLRKRGFNLKGEPDLTNKMFVRMRFVKVLRVEKVVENEKGGAARFGDGFKGKQSKTRFVDEKGEGAVDEGRVLKPCVYKIR